jgi:hypothetical protein
MKNTCSRMLILLLVIIPTLVFPKMGHVTVTASDINTVVISALLAAITHHAEEYVIESKRVRSTEDRLFNQGYCATGFSLCMTRNIAGIIASNYICKKIAEVADRIMESENKHRRHTVEFYSVIGAIFLDFGKHIIPYENNENFSGLRASCEAYWQKWNNKIVADQKAWDNRKKVD